VKNTCEGSSGNISFKYIAGTNCVEVKGTAVGDGRACIVLCDEFGICDTTRFHISARQLRIIKPIAVADRDTTQKGKMLVIDVLKNDTIPGGLVGGIKITKQPTNGTVALIGSQVTYTPNAEYCSTASADAFEYSICGAGGCDTAVVKVTVLCDAIKALSGFSPNGDGVNDIFFIEGIEAKPKNTVTLFNRWGNMVYTKKGYTNKDGWDGTWNGKPLPDGTYFYIIEDGEGNTFKGYVQIQR
jgi:gliding motility-associated-like protein